MTLHHKALKLNIILVIIMGSIFSSCEENFIPKLEEVDPQMVVDAWINNLPEIQTIKITQTLPYFDAVIPSGVNNATVYIYDNSGNQFDFTEVGTEGVYEWRPTRVLPQFGEIGKEYHLVIQANGQTFTSESAMNRVPEMDSVIFRFEPGNGFFPESYFAGFYARDPIGPGDTYWIKSWKNGVYLNKPSEINIAFDAGFSAGGNIDGSYFIQPIRDSINPFEFDENDGFISPFDPGDSVFVEIHSITYDAYVFLTEMRIQTDRQGGFAELFAVPLSNIPTNIANTDPNGDKALGFFCVSAVSRGGKRLDPDDLPE